jgi:hypothetical protein
MAFFVWITALTGFYERDIIYQLVSKGYDVGPAMSQSISLQSEKTAGVLIALRVEKFGPIDHKQLWGEIKEILTNIKAKYYSIIVAPYSPTSAWDGGNFEIERPDYRTHLN